MDAERQKIREQSIQALEASLSGFDAEKTLALKQEIASLYASIGGDDFSQNRGAINLKVKNFIKENSPEQPEADTSSPDVASGQSDKITGKHVLNELFGSDNAKNVKQKPAEVQPDAVVKEEKVKTPKTSKKSDAKPDLSKDIIVTSQQVVALKGPMNDSNSFSTKEFSKAYAQKYQGIKNRKHVNTIIGHGVVAAVGVGLSATMPVVGAALLIGAVYTGLYKMAKTQMAFGANKKLLNRVVKNTHKTPGVRTEDGYQFASNKQTPQQVTSNNNNLGQTGQPREQIQAGNNARPVDPLVEAREDLQKDYSKVNADYRKKKEDLSAFALANPDKKDEIEKQFLDLNDHFNNLVLPMHAAAHGGDDGQLQKFMAMKEAHEQKQAQENQADPNNMADTSLASAGQNNLQQNPVQQGSVQQAKSPSPLAGADIGNTQAVSVVEGKDLINSINGVKQGYRNNLSRIATVTNFVLAAAATYGAYKGIHTLWNFASPPMHVDPSSSALSQVGWGLVKSAALLYGSVKMWQKKDKIIAAVATPNTQFIDELGEQAYRVETGKEPDYKDQGKDLVLGTGQKIYERGLEITSDTMGHKQRMKP